jgi:hypothetical protein
VRRVSLVPLGPQGRLERTARQEPWGLRARMGSMELVRRGPTAETVGRVCRVGSEEPAGLARRVATVWLGEREVLEGRAGCFLFRVTKCATTALSPARRVAREALGGLVEWGEWVERVGLAGMGEPVGQGDLGGAVGVGL